MLYLNQIYLYPIKSLDGLAVSEATVLASGALQHDRTFAIVDRWGRIVNGKRTPLVHGLRTQFDLAAQTVTLQRQGISEAATFELAGDRLALAAWLSDYFGFPVQVRQDRERGFPDDTASPGPTVISTETLQAVAAWFPELSLDNVRQRFRTNLELAGGEPFWEDCLFQAGTQTVPFQVGEVQLEGVNPCQRCVVPLRDPLTGQPYPQFQRRFTAQRQATLPSWAAVRQFNHFYRLAVNTRLARGLPGKQLRVGDPVQVLSQP